MINLIGFGNQAKAWGQNLHDSHYPFQFLLRSNSQSITAAKEIAPVVALENCSGFETFPFVLLIPDDQHLLVLQDLNKQFPQTSLKIIYPHGYSFVFHHFRELFPHFEHLLLAPKGIASEIRKNFLIKTPCVAVYCCDEVSSQRKDYWQQFLQNLGQNIGIKKFIEGSFIHEMKADLFSEQSLLCSLIPYAANKSFNKLIEAGISPEIAYSECWYELKLIVDTMVEVGPKNFFSLISPNALLGSEKGKNLLFDQHFDKTLDALWRDIDNLKEFQNGPVDKTRNEINHFWENQHLQQIDQKWKEEMKSYVSDKLLE